MLSNHNLARSLSDAALGELHRQLDYKVKRRGGTLIRVDRWAPSSKRCSSCGAILEQLALSVRPRTCPICHSEHDRDINAARNLLTIGLGETEFTRGDLRVQDWPEPIRCARLNRESAQRPASGTDRSRVT
jgi:transposase